MATHISGMYLSDLPTDSVQSVDEELRELAPSQTPFLNTTGFFGAGGDPPKDTTHIYYDDAYVPLRTTLDANITAADAAVSFTDDILKSGQRVELEGEVILLGARTGAGDFVIAARSVGTGAAAAHANGTPALLVGRPEDEGSAAGVGDVTQEPRAVTTYLQEFERIIEVSDIMQNLPRYSRPGKPYDEKGQKLMRDLKMEIEHAGIWGVAQAPAPSTTGAAGAFNGIYERVVGTNTTAMGAADFTQAVLRDAVEDIADYYDPDQEVNAILLCPIRQSFVFDAWGQAHIQVMPGDPLAETYGINVRRLRIGPMLIDVIPVNRMYDHAMLYQPNFIKWKHLLSPYHKKLADDGRRMRGLISAACLPEIYAPEAHYVFTGLRTA